MDTTREAFTAHWRRLWERMENGEETADEWAQLVSLADRMTGTKGTETGEPEKTQQNPNDAGLTPDG